MTEALRVLAALAAVVVVVMTAFSLSRSVTWWVRACDFPRQQILALGLVALAGLLWLGNGVWEWGLLALLVAALGFQLSVILPYSPLWRKDLAPAQGEAGPNTLRVLVVNVLQDNRRAEDLLALIRDRDPDLFFALETDPWWDEQLAKLDDRWPHAIRHPIPNTYGLVFRSKIPLIEPELRFLLKEDVPSVRTRVRLASGDEVLIYGVHPEPPAPGEADTSLPRDAELVLAGREIAEIDAATILLGDLNDVAWSHTSRLFRRISHLIDPRVGRGLFSTFHAERWYMRWPLDHVFVSDDFFLRRIERLPYFGSDHFPILVELDHCHRAEEVNEAPEATKEDKEEAQDKFDMAIENGVHRQPAGHTSPSAH